MDSLQNSRVKQSGHNYQDEKNIYVVTKYVSILPSFNDLCSIPSRRNKLKIDRTRPVFLLQTVTAFRRGKQQIVTHPARVTIVSTVLCVLVVRKGQNSMEQT